MAPKGPLQTVFFMLQVHKLHGKRLLLGRVAVFTSNLSYCFFFFFFDILIFFLMQLASISLMRELSCHFSSAKVQFQWQGLWYSYNKLLLKPFAWFWLGLGGFLT